MSSFLHLVEELLREPGERAAFLDDPNGYLPARGFEEFTADDVELSMQLVADSFPPALASRIDPAAGLNTVTDIDLDEVPGLLAPPSDGADTIGDLDELANDDPFFDELDSSDQIAEPVNESDDVDLDLAESVVDEETALESETELFGETAIPEQPGADSVDGVPITGPTDVDLTSLNELSADFDVAFDDEIDGLTASDSTEVSELDTLSDFGDGEIDDFDGLDG